MRWSVTHGLAVSLALTLGSVPTWAQAQSEERGKALYESRCIGCHSVESHRVGPMHLGVLGRTAGKAPGYTYSAALRASQLVWSKETLAQWLQDPEKLIPGQQMDYQVDAAKDRLDLVAYLATLVASKSVR